MVHTNRIIATFLQSRIFRSFLFAALFCIAFSPYSAMSNAKETPSIAEIRLLRNIGKYDEAIQYLHVIIADEGMDVSTRQDAYNELVTIYILKGDEEAARRTASEALESFPAIKIDRRHHPAELADLYAELRKESYAPLEITSDPSRAMVYLDGKPIGTTPLEGYIKKGTHTLEVKKDGFTSQEMTVHVAAGEAVRISLPLTLTAPVSRGRWRAGVDISMNTVSFSEDSPPTGGFLGSDRSLRIGVGLVLSKPFTHRTAFQVGARYVSLGRRESYTTGTYELTHHYFAVSIAPKFYITDLPSLFIKAGYELGIHISSTLKHKVTESSTDISEYYNATNNSLLMGAGLEVPTGNLLIMLTAEYLKGITDIVKEGPSQKTAELRISTGILF